MTRPRPVVGKKGGLREGRGFSLGELERVGLDPRVARRLGIYIDTRRRSVREENIDRLRRFLADMKGGGSGIEG